MKAKAQSNGAGGEARREDVGRRGGEGGDVVEPVIHNVVNRYERVGKVLSKRRLSSWSNAPTFKGYIVAPDYGTTEGRGRKQWQEGWSKRREVGGG